MAKKKKSSPFSWKKFTRSITNIAKNAEKDDSEEKMNKLKKENTDLKNKNTSLQNEINNPLIKNDAVKSAPLLGATLAVDHDMSNKVQYDASSGLMNTTDAYYKLYSNYYDGYQKNDKIIKNILKPDIEYLKQTELTGLDYAFESIKTQNNLIDNQIKENNEKYSIDSQKIYYQSQQIMKLKTYNFFMFILYYIIALISIYILINSKDVSIAIKIMITLFIIGYPFIIDILQQFIIFLWYYIGTLIRGEVYKSLNKE